jgi:hypothetical protein
VPFLGAAVNLCGRPTDEGWSWVPGGEYLPSGRELSEYLAREFKYSEGDPADLLRVAQYVAVLGSDQWLNSKLREIFLGNFRPNSLHQLLAGMPTRLRRMEGKSRPDSSSRRYVIATTNYDDVLECALTEIEQKFHLVSYTISGERGVNFLHRSPDGELDDIQSPPNEYTGLVRDQYPVILKIHGAVDRLDEDRDSYVITEDHYIDYLMRGTQLTAFLPPPLPATLQKAQILFLGYSLRDWNLRAMLERMWKERREKNNATSAWAIQLKPKESDRLFWHRKNVKIIDMDLSKFTEELSNRLVSLESKGGEK